MTHVGGASTILVVVRGNSASGKTVTAREIRLRQDHCGRTAGFHFDVPFAETLRRHASKPQAAEYGEVEMRSWYRPLDLVPELEEHRIDASHSLDAAIELVIAGSGLGRLAEPQDLWNRPEPEPGS